MPYLQSTRARLAASLLAAAAFLAAPLHAASVPGAPAPAGAKAFRAERLQMTPNAVEPAKINLPGPGDEAIAKAKRANASTRLKRLQIGLGVEVDAAQPASSAHLRFTPVDGGQAAQWSVTSDGARALRVGLAATALPPGTQLRFSGADQPETVYGPFTEQDVAAGGATYWSPVLEGETALVELFVPAASVGEALDLRVAHVSHLFVSPAAPDAETLAKVAESCQVNFICRAATDAALADTGRAVARMTFQEGFGGQEFLCTGTLLTSGEGSRVPFFYSAAHCIETQVSASTLTTHWFYESTSCTANVRSSSYVQVPGGATLLYANPATDVLLLRLNSSAPGGALFAEWSNATVAQGQTLTAIHHPGGDLKKVSLGTAGSFESGTIVSRVTTGSFLRVNWNSIATGVTEGGSSGSGVFSSSRGGYQFRGGLLGGPSSCDATSSELYDIYSRFDQAYPFLSGYLSPSSATCSHSLSASGQSVGGGGGTGSFSVTTGNGCGWSASSNASWVTVSGSAAGSGTANFSVAANPTTAARTAVISVAGIPYTVSQGGSNLTALWWDPDEPGWGLNVNQQGDVAFATLFTYDRTGQPLWLVMSNGIRQGSMDTFSGALFRTTGPAFDANPFTPVGSQNFQQVGTMAIAFASAESGTLDYTLDGSKVVKSIQKQVFGSRAATCTPTAGSRASATNYQDLWWRPGEDGWGINITHQDDKLFATLFTYAAGAGTTNAGVWYVMSDGARQGDGSYLGALYRTRGAVFNANPFPPLRPQDLTQVGTMRLRFANGNSATLEYTIDNVPVTKSIVRQEFSSPRPLCTS